MKQPVLIRDLFCDRKWYTYVPADNTGTYWHRTDFAIPDPSRPNYFAIAQQMYGIVRPGRSFCYGQSGWIETGTWQSQTLDGWNYRYSNVVGNYIRSQVPDDCNVIQVTVCRAASGDARIGVSWENGETDGLTITSIDVGSIATTGVYIYTVSTCANAQGRALRLKIDGCGAGAARITGVRSFNTRAVGDPSTLYNYSYAGHDLVTVPATAFMHDTGGVYAEAGTIDPSCKIISAPRIGQEFELYWSPASSNSYKYTGGITRFTATDYDYKYHAGEHAAGPGRISMGAATVI